MNIKRFVYQNYVRIIIVATFCLLLILYFLFVHHNITLENFTKNKDVILAFISAHFYSSILVFGLLYSAAIALSLPIAMVLSIAGGFLFGTFLGTFILIVSATLGATISFLMVRYLGGTYFQERYQKELTAFNQEIKRYGPYYLLLIHLVPFIPFFVINIASGLTKISLSTFIITTALGIIPTTLLYAAIGNELALLGTYSAHTGKLLLILTLLAVIFFLAIILFRKRPTTKG